MKEIKLTNSEKVALVDDEDYERASAFKWMIFCDKKRSDMEYVITTTKPNTKLHRFILKLTDPSIIVDHKFHNGLDNTKENLRTCTRQENARNSRPHKKSKSKYKGVSYDNSKGLKHWRARITLNYKRILLGRFLTEKEAAIAYNNAALKHYGEFAVLNEILNDSEYSDNS